MRRFIDKGFELLNHFERLPPKIINDGVLLTGYQHCFKAVGTDIRLPDHLIIIVPHSDKVLDVLQSLMGGFCLHFFVYLTEKCSLYLIFL